MNTRKDEQWLDDELRRVVSTDRPQFDVDAWKSRYAEAYGMLLSRRDQGGARESTRHLFGGLVWRPLSRLALAAAAVVVIGFALVVTRPRPTEPPSAPPTAQSPGDVVTLVSLTMAYRHGGEKALNEQLDTALEKLGPRPDRSLLTDVLHDLES
jgi:anti-sigma-K factor RskA